MRATLSWTDITYNIKHYDIWIIGSLLILFSSLVYLWTSYIIHLYAGIYVSSFNKVPMFTYSATVTTKFHPVRYKVIMLLLMDLFGPPMVTIYWSISFQ